jgi:hypothetical protein
MFGTILDSISSSIQVSIEAIIIYFLIAFIEKLKSSGNKGGNSM